MHLRKRSLCLLWILWPALPAAEAERYESYETDAYTLHLWHLDEAEVPFANQAAPEFPLRGIWNGASAGHRSLHGLRHALSFDAFAGGVPGEAGLRGAIVTESDSLGPGSKNLTPPHFRFSGKDGAFTYEMVVKLNKLPQDAKVVALGLMTMEGADGNRLFNFRIEKEGFLAFIPLPNSWAVGGGIATLPTSGPHAIDTSHWFHVAVAYDGQAGVANNLKLYWTKVGPGVTQANLIGNGMLSNGLYDRPANFAIGNEARIFEENETAEPFPGLIDEVRISSVARHPSDFFFVPAPLRISPEALPVQAENGAGTLQVSLASVAVNSRPVSIAEPLRIGSGTHRLDFDFGMVAENGKGNGNAPRRVTMRSQLEGVDERWQESRRGMSFTFQALDEKKNVLSQSRFSAIGRSEGWESGPEDSRFTRRREPVFVPEGTAFVQLALSSGLPDTTGQMVLDNVSLMAPASGREYWANGDFSEGANTNSLAGIPAGWKRGGTDPARARLVLQRPEAPAIGITDGDQSHHGEWIAEQPLAESWKKGKTLVLSWDEAYNVIGGSLHRSTYLNVPPGHYTFRAIGMVEEGQVLGDGISLPIVIAPPVWQRVWFWPLLAAGSVMGVAILGFRWQKREARRRMETLRLQNALEKDRTRIARDMHDDLGTRATVLNLTASLAERDLEKDPDKARRHLQKVSSAARELVVAMDDLVWAVDPEHDTLDGLAMHLMQQAEELFRDSQVRYAFQIPAQLPPQMLGSEFRHHLALAVKESLHNVLQHAGPCEATLSLGVTEGRLEICVEDTGRGFDPSRDPQGHGLGNLRKRAEAVGASCEIHSQAGQGTRVCFACFLPRNFS